jgi:hypothetical protein
MDYIRGKERVFLLCTSDVSLKISESVLQILLTFKRNEKEESIKLLKG